MHNFEIAVHILQNAQIDKLHTISHTSKTAVLAAEKWQNADDIILHSTSVADKP